MSFVGKSKVYAQLTSQRCFTDGSVNYRRKVTVGITMMSVQVVYTQLIWDIKDIINCLENVLTFYKRYIVLHNCTFLNILNDEQLKRRSAKRGDYILYVKL